MAARFITYLLQTTIWLSINALYTHGQHTALQCQGKDAYP